MVSSPALTSITSDNAAWNTISDFCGSEARSRVERFTPRSASAGSECEVIHAGTIPNTTPVISDSRNAKPSTGSDGLASIGKCTASGNASARMVLRSCIGHRQAREPTHARQQHALRQHLADQPGARRSQRHADRRLCLPRRAPRQQQVGYVGAGDQQHQRRDRHQQVKSLAGFLLQVLDARAAGVITTCCFGITVDPPFAVYSSRVPSHTRSVVDIFACSGPICVPGFTRPTA